MKKEIADKWTAALRSGDYTQQHAVLASGGRTGHCCLGVLCELALKEGVGLSVEQMSCSTLYDDARIFLPESVADWAGMKTRVGVIQPGKTTTRSLAGMNDTSHSFNSIADVIETHWEEL